MGHHLYKFNFKPSKITFPTTLRMNPNIIPFVFVYDVFEMIKTFVKLHLNLTIV